MITKEKLQKIKELAERGEGGEKELAQQLYDEHKDTAVSYWESSKGEAEIIRRLDEIFSPK